jgi:dGTPase
MHHDLQDGLRAGLFDEDDLARLPIVGEAFAATDAAWPGLDPTRRRHEALRRVFGTLVEDVLTTSRALIAAADPQSVADIRHAGHPLVRFSTAVWQALNVLRRFLFERVYRAPSVMEMRARVTGVVEELFPLYVASPHLMPPDWRDRVHAARDRTALARVVSDYISGMTDRFAIGEHARLEQG